MKQLVILVAMFACTFGADLDSLKKEYRNATIELASAKDLAKQDLQDNQEYLQLKARMKAIKDSTNAEYKVKELSKKKSALKKQVTKLVLGE